MKKNISINISGIIFYIEEDCYDKLKSYLSSIYKYFSTYEDSKEIIEDIDGRIAELFYAKLNKSKQVITLEDVEELIVTMGSVDDFQAAEENPAYHAISEDNVFLDIPTEDDFKGGSTAIQVKTKPKEEKYVHTEKELEKEKLIFASYQTETYQEKLKDEQETSDKRLYRDEKRKVLGGVAAGLAHYISVDPIWIRLFFIILFSGWFFLDAAPITAVFIYVLLWFIVPKNDNLEENLRIKKLFRDPERGVLGGVCSGLAAYLGINEIFIRIVFLLGGGFFGTGFFIYIFLWMIIPEARSITDKIQMEGQPINLNNIKATISERLNMAEGEENNFSKVFYFPFKLAALSLDKLKYILRPMVSFTAEFIRIGGGLLLILISTVMSVALIASLFVLFGWGIENMVHINDFDFPAELFKNSFDFNGFMLASFYTSLFIPVLFLGLFGVMMLTRRIIWNNRLGWSVAGLWLLSLVGTGVSMAMIFQDFQKKTIVEASQNFDLKNNILLLNINQNHEADYLKPTLRLEGYEGDNLKLVKEFVSNGRNERDARMNAQMLDYTVKQKDSILLFDERTAFKPKAKYRNQHLQLILYIPYEKTFAMSGKLENLLFNTIYRNGYEAKDIDKNLWKFTKEKLICITCDREIEDAETPEAIIHGNPKNLDFSDFQGVELRGAFDVKISKGDDYKVNLLGNHKDQSLVNFDQDGSYLEISMKKGIRNLDELIRIEIIMPKIERISLQGACKADIKGFKEDEIFVELGGASKLNLSVQLNSLKAEINGASQLQAFDSISEEVYLDMSGASKAKVFARKELKAEVSGASRVIYRGNPKSVQTDVSGMSSVTKD